MHEEAGEDVPEDLKEKLKPEEIDNEYIIWNFAHEQTEESMLE
jgi:hypothetical protein